MAETPVAAADARDPKPAVERIENLARRIIDGDIILPKFQRDFVWEPEQILNLLDSIYRNYPIGSVLLWLTKQELKSERNIAGLSIPDRPREYPVNYLLDGQQRLSCICGCLFWDRKEPDSLWNIAFDLQTETFVRLDTLVDPPLTQIQLSKLREAATFFRHVASLNTLTAGDIGLYVQRSEKLFNRFKDYTIATVTLSDMTIEDVAPIFERINSTGTRLTIVDLMRAATWSEQFDLIDAIDGEILEGVADKGFADIDRKSVLRNFSAAAGAGFDADSIDNLRKLDVPRLKDASAQTVKAYQLAVDFLVVEIRIPNYEILPYTNQLVVLAELFRLCPNPTFGQRQEIKRWFWRTTLSGYFGGWNTGQMADDKKMVEAFAIGATSELAVTAGPPSDDLWRNRQFRSNNAHSKMLAIILAQKGSRDLLTGQQIGLDKALAWQNNKEFHHLFPDAFLKSKNIGTAKRAALANFALLSSSSNKAIRDRAPSEYFRQIMTEQGEVANETLVANLIDDAALDSIMRDDYVGFLEARSATLQRFALDLSGW